MYPYPFPFGLVLALDAQYIGFVVDLTPGAFRRVLRPGQHCWAIPDSCPHLVLWLSSMVVLSFFARGHGDLWGFTHCDTV